MEQCKDTNLAGKFSATAARKFDAAPLCLCSKSMPPLGPSKQMAQVLIPQRWAVSQKQKVQLELTSVLGASEAMPDCESSRIPRWQRM
jgi:hypothetical protein